MIPLIILNGDSTKKNMAITRNQLFKVAVSTDPKYMLVNVDHNPIWDERYKQTIETTNNKLYFIRGG